MTTHLDGRLENFYSRDFFNTNLKNVFFVDSADKIFPDIRDEIFSNVREIEVRDGIFFS